MGCQLSSKMKPLQRLDARGEFSSLASAVREDNYSPCRTLNYYGLSTLSGDGPSSPLRSSSSMSIKDRKRSDNNKVDVRTS